MDATNGGRGLTGPAEGLPVVEARGITKVYRMEGVEVRALDGVDMAVARGDSLAIMGPSGSGKSTLLGLLGGLDRPTSGSLAFEGRDVARLSDDELARLRNQVVGFVFQNFQLLPRTTALGNVGLPLVYRGLGRAERRRRATEALEAVGLAQRLLHRPSQLSGGEQQRVAIARALAAEPAMLLADEPTGNLDTATGEQVIELLIRLNRDHGSTLVLVTHDPALAAHAERIVCLRDGRIISDELQQRAPGARP